MNLKSNLNEYSNTKVIKIKKPLIVVAGPTACGKTDLSIELAKKINGEIISADSMQIYKYMDIGTAKPTPVEMQGIKHYLIDELYPDEDYSIAVFQKLAKKYLNEIYSKNKIPIICGGTGFYINSLVYDNDFMSTNKDTDYRNSLYKLAEEQGNDFVHGMLKEIDNESFVQIHPNNIKRVIRALEYFKETGEKISHHNQIEKQREEKYNTSFLILSREREILYERIDIRVDKMIALGLVDEVKKILEMGYDKNLVSMQGLGYKEIVMYLENQITLNEAIEIIKRDTRRFAKRQITWFKHQCNGTWLTIDNNQNLINNIVELYLSKNIISRGDFYE